MNLDSPVRSRRPILLADATNWRRRGESNSLSNALQARPWPLWYFAVLVREAGFEPASFRFRAGCATSCATLDQIWFGKLDSNPRLKASKARMLPLHHSRKLVRARSSALRRPASKAGTLLHELRPDGAHGRIRTPIFHPVTFVPVRSREGYVRKLEPPVGSDPASLG